MSTQKHEPWFKFYPANWCADPRLRIVGRAARSLWLEMLCLMHEADHYGFLMVADIPLTDAKQLARVLRDSEAELAALLAELEGAGVFSRVGAPNLPVQIAALIPVGVPDGTILSRKMLRDKAASDAGRKNGAKGGNPALNGHSDDKGITGGLTYGITQGLSQGVKTQKTEDRDSVLRTDASASGRKSLNGNHSPSKPFDDKGWLFRDGLEWLAKATAKPQAALRSQLGRWLKDAKEDSNALRRVFEAARDQDIVDPVPWITAGIKARTMAATPFEGTDAHGWRKRCQLFKDGGVWPVQWGGSKPGDHPAHPATILAEFDFSNHAGATA